MSEMSLICPGCEAEYRLPSDAIPASGREVECSACGHVWIARRPDAAPARLDLGDFAAAAPAPGPVLPPPSSRLPADVLDILRQEVEHERRLRESERAEPTPAIRTVLPEDETDWPATTVTDTDERAPVAKAPGPEVRPLTERPGRRADPQPQRIETPRPITRPLAMPPAEPSAATGIARPTPQVIRRHDPRPAPRKRRRSGAYWAGFGLSLMVAASCVALYLLAPGLAASNNPFGERMMEMRQEVDRARLWLQDRARDLTG